VQDICRIQDYAHADINGRMVVANTLYLESDSVTRIRENHVVGTVNNEGFYIQQEASTVKASDGGTLTVVGVPTIADSVLTIENGSKMQCLRIDENNDREWNFYNSSLNTEIDPDKVTDSAVVIGNIIMSSSQINLGGYWSDSIETDFNKSYLDIEGKLEMSNGSIRAHLDFSDGSDLCDTIRTLGTTTFSGTVSLDLIAMFVDGNDTTDRVWITVKSGGTIADTGLVPLTGYTKTLLFLDTFLKISWDNGTPP
jgi:hypothetical protein